MPAKLLRLLCLFALLAACGEGKVGATWEEEVQLGDGTVVLVRRTLEGDINHNPEGGDFKPSKDEIIVLDAKGLDKPPVWNSKWRPVLLDRDEKGLWYVVVTPVYCFDWPSPGFPYTQYKAINGQWQIVPFDRSLDRRPANLEWHIKRQPYMPERLNLRDKPFEPEETGLMPYTYQGIWVDDLSEC